MKAIKVSDATHARLLQLTQATGYSADTIIALMLQRMPWNSLSIAAGHCAYCKKPLPLTWEDIDAIIDKDNLYHKSCYEEAEKKRKKGGR